LREGIISLFFDFPSFCDQFGRVMRACRQGIPLLPYSAWSETFPFRRTIGHERWLRVHQALLFSPYPVRFFIEATLSVLTFSWRLVGLPYVFFYPNRHPPHSHKGSNQRFFPTSDPPLSFPPRKLPRRVLDSLYYLSPFPKNTLSIESF